MVNIYATKPLETIRPHVRRFVFVGDPLPILVIEALPLDKWGLSGQQAGTKHYVQPNATCITTYGDSYKLGCFRLTTNIR